MSIDVFATVEFTEVKDLYFTVTHGSQFLPIPKDENAVSTRPVFNIYLLGGLEKHNQTPRCGDHSLDHLFVEILSGKRHHLV